MPDFTLNTFIRLLHCLKNQEYIFQTYAGFVKNPAPFAIILRHDVDAKNINSLKTAQIERDLGIQGTYYFRMVPRSYDEQIIKQIFELGHEIGYHYEDLSRLAARGMRYAKGSPGPRDMLDLHDQHYKVLPDKGLLEMAISSFRENLEKLRRVVPVETICMHGSPLSKYDNRMLWEKYDYREFGIIGEPYFDINFEEVLYLTDTGRRWDGEAVSIRDKVKSEEPRVPRTAYRTPLLRFHSTFDIINAAKEKKLPDKIMITVHPQRWENRTFPWIMEFIWQNIKNTGKYFITSSQRKSARNFWCFR